MTKNYLESSIEQLDYNELEQWHLPNSCYFSDTKTIYDYQEQALKNITKVLYRYYTKQNNSGKQVLYNDCIKQAMNADSFTITNKHKEQFEFFQDYYPICNDKILGHNFFNQACFWMATGSGKSLVIIKTIELLHYLQEQNLIDKREILLLLPREYLIIQFQKEVKDFNSSREQKIELINLKNYEEHKRNGSLIPSIEVYYYRSDLLRNERKVNILDFQSYDNEGKWYVLLDEAHRGEKQDNMSKMQNYITVLSRDGFLFNFSATFTEAIDYATTCYNFNLEKFIARGYGKNIYLSQSYFNITNSKDELSETEKQKQVLKSLLTFTLVRKSKRPSRSEWIYHTPLLLTLVHTVSPKKSHLKLFFQKLEEIATGNLAEELFTEVKKELIKEWKEHKNFIFGEELLSINYEQLKDLEISDVLEQVFHSKNNGKIELIEGEKGKELALKLETAAKPFALIKIGDTKKFVKNNLGENYLVTKNYDNKKFFQNINNNEDIVLLLGSRSFYEGWDSNRPNVLNLINIGNKAAKKFVLQAIGRGIRIEPKKGERQRTGGIPLLETLFIYATDKDSIKAIVETTKIETSEEEYTITLSKNPTPSLFDLLIPHYKEEDKKPVIKEFSLSNQSTENFKKYFSCFDKNIFCLKTGKKGELYDLLQSLIQSNQLFEINHKNHYRNLKPLLNRIINHIAIRSQYVEKVQPLDKEIIHFECIKAQISKEEKNALELKIEKVKNYKKSDLSLEELDKQFDGGKIKAAEYRKRLDLLHHSKDQEIFEKKEGDLHIKRLANHYYLPLIYADQQADYIRHIIKEESERRFIEKLSELVRNSKLNDKWMFSKIDEHLDKIHLPYFSRPTNLYRKFHPDFIFWIQKNQNYKIVFVDPKGTTHTAFENKVDGFEELFLEKNQQPKIFQYENFKITFDLKLISDNKDQLGKKYQKYWLKLNELGVIFQ